MKNRSIRARRFAPALSVLSLAMSASVQSQVAEMSTVVVSAARVEQKLSDVIPSATVITREDIERSQAPTLLDLIQGQPGVEVGRNGGPGTVSSIFMRGQNSNNVAVLIDGVRVQTDTIGSLKLLDIPPSQIEKIEILRGNIGAVYGESAVGGVINIFTRAGSASTGPTGSVTYGSRNTSDASAGYNLRGDDYRLGISLQRFDTDGYSAMNSIQNLATVNPDKDGLRRDSVFLSGEKSVSTNIAFGFQANKIDSKVDYDSDGFGFGDPADTHQSKQKSSDITLYSKFKLTDRWSSRVGLTQSNFENREYKNKPLESSYEGDQLSAQWSNVYSLGAGAATFGLESSDAKFENFSIFSRLNKFKRSTLGTYLGYSGRVDRINYQVNLRRDQVTAKSATASIDKSANTWLVGAGYQVSDAFKLLASTSTAFRAPSITEWFTPNGLNLKPEEHRGHEYGFSYKTAFGALRIVHFNTKTVNAIVPNSGWTDYYNLGEVANEGHELNLDGNIAGWGYKFSAVSQDPRNISDKNSRLARRAKNYGSVELSKSALGIDWSMKAILSGNRKDSDFSTDINGSYDVVHLFASKKLSREWTGFVKVENAFDKQYQLARGYDAVSRGVFVTLQYQPK